AARRLRPARGRAIDHLDRLAVAQGRDEFLGFRSGGGDRRPRRARALQSDALEGALSRHAVTRALPANPPQFLPPALPVHHGERPAGAPAPFFSLLRARAPGGPGRPFPPAAPPARRAR